jgi:putative membrane protein
MEIAIKIVIGIVALFHVYVMWLEMFAWTTKGPKTFKNFDKELFPKTKSLAANQGLYNGFLAAGLIWSFFISNPETKFSVSLFFLICVVIAGVYGALTADKKIFFVQALPAILGIGLLVFSEGKKEAIINKVTASIPEESDEEQDGVYLIDSKGRTLSETFPLSANNKADFSDSLFLTVTFTDELKRPNTLNFYGPSHYAIGNKEAFKVTLNDHGVIYSENPKMDNYVLIKTVDKDLSSVISLALVNILKYKKQVVEKILQNQR